MFRLARLSLANRSLVGLVTILIAILGVLSMTNLKQELIPPIEFPQATVITVVPGASPEVVDQQVGEPISAAVQGLPGVEQVISTSRSSMSTVAISYEYGMDADTFNASVTQALTRLSDRLPTGAEPTLLAGSTADIPVVFMTASAADMPLADLTDLLRRSVVPPLEAIDGVRSAQVSGGSTERIVITPDQAAMAAANLGPQAIGAALKANGITLPLGSVTADGRSLPVSGGTPVTSLDAIRQLPLAGAAGAGIPMGEGGPAGATGAGSTGGPGGATGAGSATGEGTVILGDIASVDLVAQPATSITRMNGVDALSLLITPATGGDVVAISHDVAAAVDEIRATYPDLDLTVVFDQAPFIEQSISHLTIEGLLGLLFAVIVILLFLFSLRATLVTAISIPLSVLVAFVGLNLGGYSLNMLTLGALTIAIGRVVDDSIVVIENIKRHLSYGEQKQQAIVTAVREVAAAITASTLTTVAVFVPIAVVGGMVGELFAPFALTVTIAMLSSLLVALTIVPVLSYWLLKKPAGAVDVPAVRAAAEAAEHASALQRGFKPVLDGTQRHPVITLGIAVLLLLGTGALIPLLKVDFIGNTGQNMAMVTQSFPAGSSLQTMSDGARGVEQALAEVDGVENVMLTAGTGSGSDMSAMFGGGASATFMVITDPDADQAGLQDAIRARLASLDTPGKVTLSDAAAMSGFGGTVDVTISAVDEGELADATSAVYDALAATDHITEITSDLAPAEPTLHIAVDRPAALASGYTELALLGTVAALLSPQSQGTVRIDEVSYPVYIDTAPPPATVDELKAMTLPTATGMTPLRDLAEITTETVPVSITRQSGDLVATVSLTPADGELGAVTEAVTAALDSVILPAGAHAEIGGLAQQQQDSFQQLGLAMLVAIAIVFALLVATFRSIAQPLILLVSIPFAATGAIGLLLATGRPLGVSALIGMLMLIGIVVTNAVVLIDLINQYRQQGQSVADAIANGARQRLRPILMTAIATIFALLPMALGVTGASGFISQDLAIVVIGGLISSTALTLVLVPVLYRLLEGRREARRAARVQRAG